ncbi:MAG: sugar nucleotide-binding protein, partial [Acidobacteriota bacterium]|nr:sugar nucleotide-binding protein [Acidobacteriota bacterium]
MKILVTGAGGMVGQALNQYCELAGDEVLTYDHRTLDIADADLVKATVLSRKPDAIINCAAWTDVD